VPKRFFGAFASLAAALLCLSPAQAQTGGPRFDVAEYVVEGNTLLPAARVQAALKPYTGRDRDFATVQAAQAALQKAFADAGYPTVVVSVPEQEIRDGRIRLQVEALKLGKLRVQGNKHFDEVNVRRSLPALRPGEPPNLDRVARNLRTANENPAKQTKVVLREGEAPGSVDAVALVEDERPFRLAFTLDSTGTPSTGEVRAGVAGQYANLFNRDQVVSAQYVTSASEPEDVSIFGAGYHLPLYRFGDSIDLAYVYSDVDSGLVGTAAGPFAISGSGSAFLGRYTLNFPRRLQLDHKLVFGADWRAYQNDVRFGGGGPNQVPDITVHPLSVGYGARYQGQNQEVSALLSVVHNIPGGDKGDQATFDATRAGAQDDYTTLRLNLGFIRALPRDFQLSLTASGQYTDDLLIPGEQFGIGGMDSVRGFYEREIANDKGYSASASLLSPDLGTALGLPVRFRAVAFVDYGHVWRNDPLPGELEEEEIASTGLGVRAAYKQTLSLRLDYAWVLNGGGEQERGDQRLHGVLSLFF
jgi:hemolysin activation/secretion protein